MAPTVLAQFVPTRLRAAKDAVVEWCSGEPELHLLRRLCDPQAIAIDIGANRGVYAWHLLRCARRVIAFEPQPDLARFLREAFGGRIRIEEVALSDTEGTATMRIPRDLMLSGCATIESANHLAGEVTEVSVPLRRLDSYDFGRTGLVKIDVEGHELSVLRGAEGLLRRDRPALIIEAEERHRAGAVESVSGYLSGLGYRGYYLGDEGSLRALDDLAPPTQLGQVAARKGINNIVFLAGRSPEDLPAARRRSRHR